MKIVKLEIENFKSFGERQKIEFASPTGAVGSGLTLLVGQNNTGKTSVIDAVRLLLDSNEMIEKGQRRNDKYPTIELHGPDGLIRSCSPALNRLQYSGFKMSDDSFRIVASRRSWSPKLQSHANYLLMGEDGHYWRQINPQRDSGPHNQLVSRLSNIDQNSDQRKKLTSLLRTLIPTFGDWRIDLDDGFVVVDYTQSADLWHRASVLGDGILSTFQLAVAIMDLRSECVLFVDEPELSLHPQAQKSVAVTLKRLSANRQIVVATHSPYFVDFEIIGNGARLYRFYLNGNQSYTRSLSAELVQELKLATQDYQKPQLFDVVAKEMFFDTSVLFVEGQEDVGLLRKVAKETDRPTLPVFGYGIGGAGQTERFLRMAKDLGIRCGALLDGTEESRVEDLQEKYPEFLIKALPTEDIRDKCSQPARSAKCGVFTSNGDLKDDFRTPFLSLYDEYSHFFDVR